MSLAGRDKFCSAVSLRYVSLVSSPSVNRGTVFQSGLYRPVSCVLSKPDVLNQREYHVMLNSNYAFSCTVSLFLLKHEMLSITLEPHSVCQAFILKKPL